jgi:hypothetical protein
MATAVAATTIKILFIISLELLVNY